MKFINTFRLNNKAGKSIKRFVATKNVGICWNLYGNAKLFIRMSYAIKFFSSQLTKRKLLKNEFLNNKERSNT